MPLRRSPPGGITIGPTFYPGGRFLPVYQPAARARAPAGGVTIGGVFYPGGRFIPPADQPDVFGPQPSPEPVLEPGARIVDSLVNLGPPELGEIRTVRVHIDDGMTASDVLAEIETVVEAWNQQYQQRAAQHLIDFWRQR